MDRAWFSPSLQPALLDYWAVYDARHEEIDAATLAAAAANPAFAPIIATMSDELRLAQGAKSHEQLRRAICDGAWEPYEANLREQGAAYGAMGIGFSDWHDLVGPYVAVLVPHLITAYGAEPGRLSAALICMHGFLDRAMATIGESYLAAKEAKIRDGERLRVRSLELELENRRVQEATRLKSEFLANMSHELRTPLNAIIGFTELLHDGQVGALLPRQQEFLGDVLTSSRHLLQLINDILDLSKVEAGRMEFYPEPLDLARVIREVAWILRTPAATRKITVATDVPDDLGPVVLDAARFKQVLYNYLSNALKFTPEGGRVTIRVVGDGDAAFRLEVEDTGIGITPEDQVRLFVEFQQLDGGAAKQHEGTGLGLALTRRLVEAQGGAVAVRSTPGQGSTFCATLPRRAGEPLPVALLPTAPPGAPIVLVVEDDPHDRETIATILLGAGYGVETAVTGAEAIAKASARVYQAVTLDLILPDMSGLEVLTAIRGGQANAAVPVVVMTIVVEHATAGFVVHDVLGKPIDGDALIASLRRLGLSHAPGRHVLVVDDDPASLRLMSASLGQLGYQAECHTSGENALVAVAGRRPLAVIVDLLMPGMDGFEFLDRFRQEERHQDIPVLVWTVKDLTRDDHARLRRSAAAIVRKGTGTPQMLAELEGHLPARAVTTEED